MNATCYRCDIQSVAVNVISIWGSCIPYCLSLNAFSSLYRFRDGDTIDVLADALDDLRKTLQGVRAISFTGDSHDVIEYVANLFGPSKQINRQTTIHYHSHIYYHHSLHYYNWSDYNLHINWWLFLIAALISSEQQNGKQFIKPVNDVRSFIELSYYANSLAAHFALDAVVMCTLLKTSSNYEDTDSNLVSILFHQLCSSVVHAERSTSVEYWLKFSRCCLFFAHRSSRYTKAIWLNHVENTVICSDMNSYSVSLAKNSKIYSKIHSIGWKNRVYCQYQR